MKTYFPIGYFSRGKMRPVQEVPERALRLVEAARGMNFDVQTPDDAGLAPILAVHASDYVQFLRSAHSDWKAVPEDWGDEVMANIHVRQPNALRGILAQAGYYLADGSCPIGSGTWEGVYASAQSAIAAAKAIAGGAQRAWALCRPPGHHARRDAAGGFCYLNNAAIAAECLRSSFERVLIVDPDMHHGQGIQEIFYRRRDVAYVSIHGDPTNFYPATAGFADERGEGAGFGFNLNLPMPHGSSEATFFEQVRRALGFAREFEPSVIVLALGFDIYERDVQSKVAVSTEGFRRLGEAVRSLARPVLVVQEGGYDVDSLDLNARAFFLGLGA
jgi:acetoin utilization deacetylase AcuC-like enzyme